MKKFRLKDVECINCGSKSTVSNHKLSYIGAMLAWVGAIMSITIIGTIVGIPMILIGLPVAIVGTFTGDKYIHRCRTCKYKWETIEK